MNEKLYFYEELMLLMLHHIKGTSNVEFVEQGVAGAIVAELLLEKQISIDGTKNELAQVENEGNCDDPILAECFEMIRSSPKLGSVSDWISRLSNRKHLRRDVAHQLCQRGILREDERKVFLLFTNKIYPRVIPGPERKIKSRILNALKESSPPDPKTTALISIADGTSLLRYAIGKDEVKRHAQRIKDISNKDLTGRATRKVIGTILLSR